MCGRFRVRGKLIDGMPEDEFRHIRIQYRTLDRFNIGPGQFAPVILEERGSWTVPRCYALASAPFDLLLDAGVVHDPGCSEHWGRPLRCLPSLFYMHSNLSPLFVTPDGNISGYSSLFLTPLYKVQATGKQQIRH